MARVDEWAGSFAFLLIDGDLTIGTKDGQTVPASRRGGRSRRPVECNLATAEELADLDHVGLIPAEHQQPTAIALANDESNVTKPVTAVEHSHSSNCRAR